MNIKTLSQLIFPIILLINLTSCNTLMRGVDQSIGVKTNVDSIIFVRDSTRVYLDHEAIALPRSEFIVLKAQKPGYESQEIIFNRMHGYFPLNFLLGSFTALIPALSAEGNSLSNTATIALFFGFWGIGGMIDVASGAQFYQVPENIVVNLYPTLRLRNVTSSSIVCGNFKFYEARFLGAIGRSYMYHQLQYAPIYLVDHKVINPVVSKDVINEYLSNLGYTVPGKKFNNDTVGMFRIEAIVDSLSVEDIKLKGNDRIVLNSEKTSGEIIRDFSDECLYTHLKMEISWRITHVASGKSIDKSVNTDVYYYAENIQSAYGKHLRTNFNQLLNDEEVGKFLSH